MNNRIIIYSINVILLCMFVAAAEVDETVTSPSECTSGIAKTVKGYNDSVTLKCVPSSMPGYTIESLGVLYDAPKTIYAKPITTSALDMQMELAESATIWTTADDIYWDYKFEGFTADDVTTLGIKAQVTLVWSYIWAFFVLVLETVKLVYYLCEVILVIYIIFTLVPNTFFKLRDAIVRSYIRKYAT